MNYLELYEAMLEEATEKTAEAQKIDDQMEGIAKYAAAADEIFDEYVNSNGAEFDDYDEEDVAKLATLMIEHDAAVLEAQEAEEIEMEAAMAKVAEADQLGRIQAQAFIDELYRLAE